MCLFICILDNSYNKLYWSFLPVQDKDLKIIFAIAEIFSSIFRIKVIKKDMS